MTAQRLIIGSRIELAGEMHLTDGSFSLRDNEGRRWTFDQDRRTRPFLGKRVVVEGECISPGRLKVISIRDAKSAGENGTP